MNTFKSFILQEAAKSENRTEALTEEIKASGMLTKCSQFLQANKEAILNGKFLRRQTNDNAPYITYGKNQFVFYKKIRTNRRPRDTRAQIHEYVDNFFKSEFGVRYRSNALFCKASANFKDSDYGNYILNIFPVNNYKMCASPKIEDLSIALDYNLASYALSSIERFIIKNARSYFPQHTGNPESIAADLTAVIQFHYFEGKTDIKRLLSDAKKIFSARAQNIEYYDIDVDNLALLKSIIVATRVENVEKLDELVNKIINDYLKSMQYEEFQTYSGLKPKNEVMINATGYFAIPNIRTLKDIFAKLL